MLTGTVAVPDTCYTATYAGNTNAGTATVTLAGKGNCAEQTTLTFTIAKKSGAELLTPPDTIHARLGYPLSAVSLPAGWRFSASDSSATYALADIGKAAHIENVEFVPDALQAANYDWPATLGRTFRIPLKVALKPDTAWLQFASVTSQAAIISVKSGAWEHLNWSSLTFADSLTVSVSPAGDGNYRVTVSGKPGGPYENVSLSAIVDAEGRVPVVPPALGAGRHTGLPIQQRVFDVRGNYVGRSLSEVKTPGVYIVRQGSQTRRIVVR
jgi:hypothetical protein